MMFLANDQLSLSFNLIKHSKEVGKRPVIKNESSTKEPDQKRDSKQQLQPGDNMTADRRRSCCETLTGVASKQQAEERRKRPSSSNSRLLHVTPAQVVPAQKLQQQQYCNAELISPPALSSRKECTSSLSSHHHMQQPYKSSDLSSKSFWNIGMLKAREKEADNSSIPSPQLLQQPLCLLPPLHQQQTMAAAGLLRRNGSEELERPPKLALQQKRHSLIETYSNAPPTIVISQQVYPLSSSSRTKPTLSGLYGVPQSHLKRRRASLLLPPLRKSASQELPCSTINSSQLDNTCTQ